MPTDPPVSLWPNPDALGTLTDLYEITMMAGYAGAGMDQAHATFELFVRRLPAGRAYLVFAGLEQALGDLLKMAFSAEQVDAFRSWPNFSRIDPGFFDRLKELRFTGEVWAVREGSVVFPGEPLVRIEAPLLQAQWI
ncbi:MAG: nicotinate phosphoribosyltransferase, partial [Isosphaeraceae bacterium]